MEARLRSATAPTPGAQELERTLERINGIILGKSRAVRLALACLLARGHLLIEDVPGVGKTTLAQVLARVLGLQFKRIQFTSDLLPADIIGVSIFDNETQSFRFHPGPLFCPVVLADEINRATPKAQSALLEAMEERQVSADGQTWSLPEPFFVIATQNPRHQIGTFPLPESQLDRFLMRISIGYPDHDAERRLLKGVDRRELLRGLQPAMDAAALTALQGRVSRVHAADALIDYVQALVEGTRRAPHMQGGLSPRAGLALLRASQAWALLDDREVVLPEDVQAVAESVMGHRLQLSEDAGQPAASQIVEELVRSVPIP